MAPYSSTLAWKIPWTEEPGRLQSMGSRRVRHDWATSLSRTGEGNGNPLQCSCLENPRDGGAWWAAVYGVAQSRTQLKQLSSSSKILKVCLAKDLNRCPLLIQWVLWAVNLVCPLRLSVRPSYSLQAEPDVHLARGKVLRFLACLLCLTQSTEERKYLSLCWIHENLHCVITVLKQK